MPRRSIGHSSSRRRFHWGAVAEEGAGITGALALDEIEQFGHPTRDNSCFLASRSIPWSRARFSPRILRLACSVSCG